MPMDLHEVVRIKATGALGTIINIHTSIYGSLYTVEIGISSEIEGYLESDLERVNK